MINKEKSSPTGSPGGPRSRRERKKERTRQEIYQAAMELFVARGFDAVTVEDICQAADVARGTFFLHFPTKDALLLEYGAQVTAELHDIIDDSPEKATNTLYKVVNFLAERALRHADIVRLVVREVMNRPTALANATEQSRDLMQVLAGVVRRGQAAGELRPGIEPRLAAGLVTAAYFAIVSEWVRCGGQFDLTKAVRRSLDVILGGLAKKEEKTTTARN
ncbi:MAG: TetR/AcrR family transcriptional regulator [Thermodesulfobacteriota bacterium]|jgi:AcrR family transcriptional regulator